MSYCLVRRRINVVRNLRSAPLARLPPISLLTSRHYWGRNTCVNRGPATCWLNWVCTAASATGITTLVSCSACYRAHLNDMPTGRGLGEIRTLAGAGANSDSMPVPRLRWSLPGVWGGWTGFMRPSCSLSVRSLSFVASSDYHLVVSTVSYHFLVTLISTNHIYFARNS